MHFIYVYVVANDLLSQSVATSLGLALLCPATQLHILLPVEVASLNIGQVRQSLLPGMDLYEPIVQAAGWASIGVKHVVCLYTSEPELKHTVEHGLMATFCLTLILSWCFLSSQRKSQKIHYLLLPSYWSVEKNGWSWIETFLTLTDCMCSFLNL